METNQYNLEWNVKRILSKTNYHIHTDAVKNFILPKKNYEKDKEWLVYAEEADLLNVALFNCTTKDFVTIEIKQQESQDIIYAIYNINGQLIAEKDIEYSKLIKIDISNYKSGYYILKLTDKLSNKNTIMRIIKE